MRRFLLLREWKRVLTLEEVRRSCTVWRRDPERAHAGKMRNLLFVAGLLCVVFGAVKVYDTRALGDAIVSMLVVVCGAVLFGSGAIVGAVEGLRAPAPMLPPQPQQGQWQPPG